MIFLDEKIRKLRKISFYLFLVPTVALIVSLSLSSTVALKSSVFEDSKDKVAEGENSAFAIVTSFSDCSYSSLDIIKSGLLFFFVPGSKTLIEQGF